MVFSVGVFNGKSITTLIVFVSVVALLVSGEHDRGFIIYVLSICGLVFFALFFQMHFSRIMLSEDVLVAGGGLYKARIPLSQLDVAGASLLEWRGPVRAWVAAQRNRHSRLLPGLVQRPKGEEGLRRRHATAVACLPAHLGGF